MATASTVVEMTTWRDRLREIVEALPLEELPDLIGELSRAKAITQVRLQTPTRAKIIPTNDHDRYLTANEVADRLHLSPKWCYAHQEELGATKLGAAIRFPERSVERYLAAHR